MADSSPCYGCTEKIPPDCHVWCEKYIDFDTKHKANLAKKRAENNALYGLIEIRHQGMKSREKDAVRKVKNRVK